LVPSPGNYEKRKKIAEVFRMLKKCKVDGYHTKFINSLLHNFVNLFDNTYTTPWSLCSPPLKGRPAAIRTGFYVYDAIVVESTEESIMVEQIDKFRNPGRPLKRFTFSFQNGEWVCGQKVLSF